jgi:hypothetical protein
MYMAYLCFPRPYDEEDEEDQEPTLKFEEPSRYLYEKVIPISFTVLHEWADKDKRLYK